MNIPEEYELISLFGVEPVFEDQISQVPFFYNVSTYSFENLVKQKITVTISPAYNEMKIVVEDSDEIICSFSFRDIHSLNILQNTQKSSRIIITKKTTVIKVNFNPRFLIFIEDEINR